jgi:hypothetical protein
MAIRRHPGDTLSHRFAAVGRSRRVSETPEPPHPALIEALAADVNALRSERRITFEQAYDAITLPDWARQYEARGGDMISLGNRVINKAKSIGRARRPVMRGSNRAAEARRSPRGRRAPVAWTTDNTDIRTWFERDRASVVLTTLDDTSIIEWWDDDVHEAVQDGFLNPRDWHGSAVEYANQMGAQPPAGVREAMRDPGCPSGAQAYMVGYIHKVSPSPQDVWGPVCLNDNAFSDSKTLGAALRKAHVLIPGGQVRQFRVEGDKVVVFPSAPGMTTYWHSIILTAGVQGGGHSVRDYLAIDSRDRPIAGPFKSYSDARQAAGTGGAVQFVPTGRSAPPRASEAGRGVRRPPRRRR